MRQREDTMQQKLTRRRKYFLFIYRCWTKTARIITWKHVRIVFMIVDEWCIWVSPLSRNLKWVNRYIFVNPVKIIAKVVKFQSKSRQTVHRSAPPLFKLTHRKNILKNYPRNKCPFICVKNGWNFIAIKFEVIGVNFVACVSCQNGSGSLWLKLIGLSQTQPGIKVLLSCNK